MSEKNNDIPFPADLDLNNVDIDMMSDDDKQELLKWMMGLETEPPNIVKKISTNLAKKINLYMGYIITRSLKRIDNIIDFMEASEDYLFDVEELINQDDREEMLNYYKTAGTQLQNSLEWMRKYVYQNKEELKAAGEEISKLQSLLMSLPSDVLEDLIGALEKGDYDRIMSDD